MSSDTPNTTNNPIDQFVTGLLEKGNLTDVSEEKKEEYHQNILGLVQQKLGMEIMKIMPPEHADEFIKITEKNPKPEDFTTFFQKAIPDFDKKVAVMLQDFEKDFMDMMKQSSDFLNNKK